MALRSSRVQFLTFHWFQHWAHYRSIDGLSWHGVGWWKELRLLTLFCWPGPYDSGAIYIFSASMMSNKTVYTISNLTFSNRSTFVPCSLNSSTNFSSTCRLIHSFCFPFTPLMPLGPVPSSSATYPLNSGNILFKNFFRAPVKGRGFEFVDWEVEVSMTWTGDGDGDGVGIEEATPWMAWQVIKTHPQRPFDCLSDIMKRLLPWLSDCDCPDLEHGISEMFYNI